MRPFPVYKKSDNLCCTIFKKTLVLATFCESHTSYIPSDTNNSLTLKHHVFGINCETNSS